MVEQLQSLEQRFIMPANGSCEQLLHDLYRFGENDFCCNAAVDVFDEASQQATELATWNEATGSDPDMHSRIARLMVSISASYSSLIAAREWRHDEGDLSMPMEDLILRFIHTPAKKEQAILPVFRFILAWTRRLDLRHKGDAVFVQRRSEAGLGTRAWEPAVDVGGVDISSTESLIKNICTKSRNAGIWEQFMTVPMQKLMEKLRCCVEPEFRELHTTRTWMSFSDGLYCQLTDTFMKYEELDRFGVPPDLATCTYHDLPFEPAFSRVPGQRDVPLHPLAEVPTPLLDTIMNTQRLDGHARFSLLAMLGRCLYPAGMLERWQICPFLKGRAGTASPP